MATLSAYRMSIGDWIGGGSEGGRVARFYQAQDADLVRLAMTSEGRPDGSVIQSCEQRWMRPSVTISPPIRAASDTARSRKIGERDLNTDLTPSRK
jgi:hypothetical protein